MLKAIILSLVFAIASAAPTVDPIVNGTGWKCPSPVKVGDVCKCDAVKSTIHCNRPTYQQIEHFFNELKSINSINFTVESFRVENYQDSELDMFILSPALKFETIDFRNNKNLKYIHHSGHSKYDYIEVRNFILSNCSLKHIDWHELLWDEVEHIDLSHNYLTYDRYYYHGFGPYLKTINLSMNQFTEVGDTWFSNSPNVDEIDLSHNHIQNIMFMAFNFGKPIPEKMNKEIIINLSNNKLSENSEIESTAFKELIRPSKFLLGENDFHHLPENFAEILNRHGSSIDMGNNQLICDCKSEWIRSKALVYEKRLFNYTCSNLNNTSIFKVTKNLCK